MKIQHRFDDKGIPLFRVTGGLPVSKAIQNHPDLIPFLRSLHPPRINNENRAALLLYNKYIAQDVYGLKIEFEPGLAIIPTPVMRYNFLIRLFNCEFENHVESVSRSPLKEVTPPLKVGLSNKTVIEIGTGASAIIAMLAAKHFGVQVLATEMNPIYLEIAQRNIKTNHLEKMIDIIDSKGQFLNGVFSPDLRADYIISNPPYYDEIRSPKLLWGGSEGELVGGDQGAEFVLRILTEGWAFLKDSGIISFIIPNTRQETLIVIEEFLNQHEYNYEIIGLLAGNRTRYVFRVHKNPINFAELID